MTTKAALLSIVLMQAAVLRAGGGAPASETGRFVEWLLDTQLTSREKAELDATPFDARMTEALRQIQVTVEALPSGQRGPLRAQIQAAFVKSLRDNPANPASTMLLAAYQRSHGGGSKGNIPAQLIGKWSSVSTSNVTFADRAGSYGPPSGNGLSYTFMGNGDVELDFMVQSTIYNCTVNVFMADKGRAQVEGASLRIDTAGGAITSRDNCNASGNYKKTGTPKQFTFSWQVLRDQWGEKLCLADPGKEPQCYYRK